MPDKQPRREEIRAIWNQNADYWDEKMGEGNHFHKALIEPAQKRLLNLQPEELLQACFHAGFVLEALEEPVLGQQARTEKFWDAVYKSIPPALVARMRLLQE